jgi:hypothetical protein
VVADLLIKPKQQHGKNQNKNTGLFINCMDIVVVKQKINSSFFFVCLGLGFIGKNISTFVQFSILKSLQKLICTEIEIFFLPIL